MKNSYFLILMICVLSLSTKIIQAETYIVNSQQSFDDALSDAAMNDSIIWELGTYSDIYMEISKSNLYIAASILGGTIFNGNSRVRINSDYITLEGFQFIGGSIGSNDIINTYGSHNLFHQINIKDYTCNKYLRIREECQYNVVRYCNFENKLNLNDQNILSILVDESTPGYHKIQHCSFKNFDGTGNDLGIEPIRIGLSTQADRNSRSLVEYCYFTQCNGDGELISSKASQNVYRFNTFEDNPKAELVLRHGSEAIVYGNFFIDGKGGVRVREGQDHYIYNNYFYELDDRAIFLQNESSDPLDNINIAFNTVVDCSEIILGGDGSFRPTNVSFSNNIFTAPDDDLFEESTGMENWIGNITSGSLGIPAPSSGITPINPLLVANSEGFFGLAANSPAIDAAMPGFTQLPQFEGMEPIDTDLSFDLMQQDRPSMIANKDLGCNEFPHNTTIQPIATEENTGPNYNTDIIDNINELFVTDLIQFYPNPSSKQIIVTLKLKNTADVKIDIIDIKARVVDTILNESISAGESTITKDIESLPAGVYTILASKMEHNNGVRHYQSLMLIKK